jgi:hypothetical protein
MKYAGTMGLFIGADASILLAQANDCTRVVYYHFPMSICDMYYE